MLGAVPSRGRQSAEVAVEAELVVGRLERTPGLQPVMDRLLPGQNRVTRRGRARPAGLRSPELGHLVGEYLLDAVIELPHLDRAGGVLGELLAGQVALLVSSAGQDGIVGAPEGGAL